MGGAAAQFPQRVFGEDVVAELEEIVQYRQGPAREGQSEAAHGHSAYHMLGTDYQFPVVMGNTSRLAWLRPSRFG